MKKYLSVLLSALSVLLGLVGLFVGVSSLEQAKELALGERTSLVRPYFNVATTSTVTGDLTVGTSTPSSAGALQQFIDTAAVGTKGLVIRGVTGQTASLLELQNGSGVILWSVGADGSSSSTNVSSTRYYADSGTNAAPAYTFSGDEDSGLFRVGNNNIGLAVAGSNVLDINGARIDTPIVFNGPNGSVSSPTYSFTNDTDTGILLGSSAGNNLSFTAGGAQRFTIDTLFVSSTLSIVPSTNNAIDLGSSSSTAWRSLYVSSSVVVGGRTATTTLDLRTAGGAGRGTCIPLSNANGATFYLSVTDTPSIANPAGSIALSTASCLGN